MKQKFESANNPGSLCKARAVLECETNRLRSVCHNSYANPFFGMKANFCFYGVHVLRKEAPKEKLIGA